MDEVLPKGLVDAVLQGSLIPFVGAGVSMAVRGQDGLPIFPSWAGLLKSAAEHLRQEGKREYALILAHLEQNQPDYLEAAKFAKIGLGAQWADFMRSAFDPKRSLIDEESLEIGRLIWGIGSRLVLTTNYDRVLRWTCPDPDGLDEIATNAPTRFVDIMRNQIEQPLVWHIHGLIREPSEMIFAPEQYFQLYSESTWQTDAGPGLRPALTTLKTLILTRHFLFIGFSMDDEAVVAQFAWAMRTFADSGGPHYVIARARDVQKMRSATSGIDLRFIEFSDFGVPLEATLRNIVSLRLPNENINVENGQQQHTQQQLITRPLENPPGGLVRPPGKLGEPAHPLSRLVNLVTKIAYLTLIVVVLAGIVLAIIEIGSAVQTLQPPSIVAQTSSIDPAPLPILPSPAYGAEKLSGKINPSIKIEACMIRISGGPAIHNGWVILDDGDFFEADVNGNSLRFVCPPDEHMPVAIVVNYEDGTIRHWRDVSTSPKNSSVLSIQDAATGLPVELIGKMPELQMPPEGALSEEAGGWVPDAKPKNGKPAPTGGTESNLENSEPRQLDFDEVIGICSDWSHLGETEKKHRQNDCYDYGKSFKIGTFSPKDLQKAAEIQLAACIGGGSMFSCEEALSYYSKKCNDDDDGRSCYLAGAATKPTYIVRPLGGLYREEWFAKACALGHRQACLESDD